MSVEEGEKFFVSSKTGIEPTVEPITKGGVFLYGVSQYLLWYMSFDGPRFNSNQHDCLIQFYILEQILKIQERLAYYAELKDRKATILKSIDEQGKLTDSLRAKIEACMVKSALEDLYQPYKPKRRTRAMIAREKGLEPLADISPTLPCWRWHSGSA